MIKNIKFSILGFLALLIGFSSCKKQEYSFGEIKTPEGLTLTTVVVGTDASNPNGNGTGNVTITSTSNKTLTYNIDFGDGVNRIVPSGTLTYKYNTPGTNTFTITVNAIGTGGAISTISKTITVFVAFEIPAAILTGFTGTGSKIWITDKNAYGHFGVDDPNRFDPNPGVWWYAAGANTRDACAYDDEITFSKDANNFISMSINNKGQSFSIGASSAFYGVGGPDGCYAINTGGTKKLIFSNASNSGFSSANSTKIQFAVPGNGIINFGTGGTVYEIISVTNTTITLRNIGIDGNAWYQKLILKP